MLLARVSGIQYGSTETFWHRKKNTGRLDVLQNLWLQNLIILRNI